MRGLALGCGALVVAAFPEPALWWWAWVALVPVLLLVTTSPTGGEAALRTGGEAALRAWLAGAGFTAVFYHWLATQGVLLLVVVAVCPRQHRSVDHLAVHLDGRTVAGSRHDLASPRDLVGGRRERLSNCGELSGVDAYVPRRGRMAGRVVQLR
jgi:hypothetical protein